MANQRNRRRISLGTFVMLALTLVVCAGCLAVLPKLQGNTVLQVDASQVLNDLTLSGSLPELSLSDIPIKVTTPQPTVPPATPIPTLQPEVQQLMATPTPSLQTGTLTLGGGLYVETGVRKSAYFSEADTYDFEETLALLAPEMQSDLSIVPLNNLIMPGKKVSELIAPEEALALLTTTGVDVVPLGFSQAFDQGMEGLNATLTALRQRGMSAAGVYTTATEANTPAILHAGGLKVSVLHYVDELSSTGAKKIKKEDAAFAVPTIQAETIARDIDRARASGAQVVIVSLHWGAKGKTAPTKDQQALAQALADSDADIIVGTGTKALQPIEMLTGKDHAGQPKQVLCAYNLGALLSDDRDKTAYIGSALLHVKITCDASGHLTFDSMTYTPTYAWRYKQGSQYQYRVVASDTAAPDAMSDDQRKVMERSLESVRKVLEGSPVTPRTP